MFGVWLSRDIYGGGDSGKEAFFFFLVKNYVRGIAAVEPERQSGRFFMVTFLPFLNSGVDAFYFHNFLFRFERVYFFWFFYCEVESICFDKARVKRFERD